jgi:DNA-binding transcriptional regulator YiaG
MSSDKSISGGPVHAHGDLPRVTSSELSYLLSQPRTPKVVIHLLRSCGLSHAHLAAALGVSQSSVANWSSGKSEPNDELYEKLDFIRTIASHVLANRLEGDDERIVKAFLLGIPQGVVNDEGVPCTTLAALANGDKEVVIEAVRAFGTAVATTEEGERSEVEARAIW